MAATDAAAALNAIEQSLSSDPAAAAESLRQLLRKDPLNAWGYRLLIRAISAAPATGGTEVPAGTISTSASIVPRVAEALAANDLESAEITLRRYLLERPADPKALELLAEFATRLDYDREAEELLRLADELAPRSASRTVALAALLQRQDRTEEAMTALTELLVQDPENIAALNLKGGCLTRLGRANEALACYDRSLHLKPRQPDVWSRRGQALRTMGHTKDGAAALRRAIDLAPGRGDLWWSLSDFKTRRATAEDIATMTQALSRSPPASRDEMFLHFALGKAFEDAGEPARAFQHYALGNDLQRQTGSYDPEEVAGYVAAAVPSFSPHFFSERESWGCASDEPVFIIGMPRAGSTLLEQILGRHSQIEATMELPEMVQLGEGLAGDLRELPATLSALTADEARSVGGRYLDRTNRYRVTDKPLYTDKMPNNWLYVPLIRLALPNARILDIRRDPLDCGFSNFKQLFLSRQEFSTDLDWMGRYYRDYVRLMTHIDDVIPGCVHRVVYEELVERPESVLRGVLDYLSLPFEPDCLRRRGAGKPIMTASADQVREPINKSGIGAARAFESFLGPLKSALGDLLTHHL